MKTVLIMRAGDSHPAEDSRDDIEKVLSEQGRHDAQQLGLLLRDEALVPEFIVSSTARRARQTAVAVADACDSPGNIEYRPELYGGDLDDYVGILQALSEEFSRVLVVGHYPAAEELVGGLSGLQKELPTAALAHVRFAIETWPELNLFLPGGLANLWRPRELIIAPYTS